jgi:hypothetical protein
MSSEWGQGYQANKAGAPSACSASADSFAVSGLVCGGLPPLSGWPIRLQAITPAQSKPGSCHFFVSFGLFRA